MTANPGAAASPARQPMQLAERVRHATPVSFRLGRSTLHIGHHHQTLGEVPAVRCGDRHRHDQTFAVEVSEERGLPRQINVASPAKTSHRELPVGAHAPDLVDADSASERFDASDVVTPPLECLPSHHPHLRGLRTSPRAAPTLVKRNASRKREHRIVPLPGAG